MTNRKLVVNTTALDEDGRMVTFEAGTTVSAKVAAGITNPRAFAAGDSDSEKPAAKKAASKKAASSDQK